MNRMRVVMVLATLIAGVAGCGVSQDDPQRAIEATEEQKKNLAIAGGAVEKNILPFMECYNSVQATDKALKGKIVFRTTVQTNGKASDISLPVNELGEQVGACFTTVLESMTFPALTAPTLYEESLCFDPDGAYCQK